MRARRPAPAPAIATRSRRGSASAVVILVTVLLAVFGVLALVSSLSGYRLAQRHAEWTKAYYAADRQAEELLARVEEDLAAAAGEAGSISADGAFPGLARDALDPLVASETVAVLSDAAGLTIRAAVGAEGAQYVRMELRVDYADGPVPDRLARVAAWRQWQKPFAYDENPGDIWGGES